MKIFSPNEYHQNKQPSENDFDSAIELSSEVLNELYNCQDIVGATLYGSCVGDRQNWTIASDIDWLIIFSSLEQQLECNDLLKISVHFQSLNIPFNSPITNINSIERGYHNIGPLLFGIRSTPKRIVIGQDPVQVFNRYGFVSTREYLERALANTSRFFFENVSTIDLSSDGLTKRIQLSIDYFDDIFRSMIILFANTNSIDSPIFNTEYYVDSFSSLISEECIEIVKTVAAFKSEYRSILSSNSSNEYYEEFLRDNISLVFLIARFCLMNGDIVDLI